MAGGQGARDRTGTPRPSGRRSPPPGLVFNAAVTVLDVGVAILVYALARSAGAGEATAYLAGSAGPLLGTAAVWLRARELSGASLAILSFTVLSSAAALAGSRDPQVLLYKDAVVTALVGLVFAGSMLLPRPLAFYFGQRYATDGTHDGMERWASMWAYPLFRRAQYVITTVWAVVYVVEAAAKTYLIRTTSFSDAYAWTQVLPFAAAGVATILTVVFAQHYQSVADRQERRMSGST